MNYDFFLNNKGDLSFETVDMEESEQLVFNFHYATSDSLLFNFFPEIHGTKNREQGMFQFNFNTYTVLYDKKNKLISGDDYIRQAIKIQLETELGTLRENLDVGSDLYKYRHMFMNENAVVTQIEKVVAEAIKPLVPNSEVKVYLMKTEYYDFYNAIKISVTFLDKIMWFTL